MKRIIIVFMVLTLMLSSVCYAEEIDLTTMSDDELIALRNEINIELESRAASNTSNEVIPGLVYVSNGKEIHIKGYTGENPVLVLPETIDGLPVVAIDSSAFKENTTITSITFPSSITKIGTSAFYDCKNLKTIEFPKTQIDKLELGDSAFSATGLSGTIVINARELTAGMYVFASCRNKKEGPANYIFLCDKATFKYAPFYYSDLSYVYFKANADVKIKRPGGCFANTTVNAVYLPNGFSDFSEDMFYDDPLAVIYCQDENSKCIKEAQNQFIITNCSEYEARTTQILNEVAGMGYIFE